MWTFANMCRLLIYALAVYRVTRLLWWENGPFDMFDWVRHKAGVWVDSKFKRQHSNTFFSQLLLCPHCLGMWLAVPALTCWYAQSPILDLIATWLAISGLVSVLFGDRE